ncbi:LacI family DNA-binding transcriptional regulator [Catenulispora rubra]|uniref:LacI family DNA-binding transcriptional regulator n=1 Tax=Catenulispora rubra TaxID=280293 RepID=UPI001892479B|nr:LacI family DNA-binding transcriptional regulator [Catenulispora rubra]
MTKSAGMRDVAQLAGVSVGTVSNVLNRPDAVAPGTRARVQAAIAELGFVRSESARLLRAGSSQVLALLALDLADPFFVGVLRGAEGAARAADLGVLVMDSASSAASEATHLAMLAQQRVRGVLVTPADVSGATLAQFGRARIPYVLVDRDIPGGIGCRVLVDDVAGGAMAVAHLIAAGHRRIAYVAGPMELPQYRDRLEGARSAVAEAGGGGGVREVGGGGGIAGAGRSGGGAGERGSGGNGGVSSRNGGAGGVGVELVVLPACAHGDVASGRDAAARMLGLPERPTGVFCGNDLIALGMLQGLFAAGVSVPRDVAIVGYDDLEVAAAAVVPLTSIRRPAARVGRAAAEILLEESGAAAGEHVHRELVFQPELVVRASSLAPAPNVPAQSPGK